MPQLNPGPRWRRYLRFWQSDVAADVDDELRFHFEAREAELLARGLSPHEAGRITVAEFGDVEATRHRLHEIGERVNRRRERRWWWHQLVADLRYALRALRRTPGFSAAVIATLALGIGANAAIFSTVDRLLLRPPPLLRHPARMHRVYLAFPTPDGAGELFMDLVPFGRFQDLVGGTRSFARAALASAGSFVVGTGGDARELPVGVVSSSFFGFFDAPPALGRYFSAREDAPPTGAPVAVLSWATWQGRYLGRLDVLGTSLQIGPTAYTIIGVAPRSFVGLWPEQPPVAYVPLSVVAAADAEPRSGETWWTTRTQAFASMLVERLPVVSAAAADTELTNALRRSVEEEAGGKLAHQPYAVAASILEERGPNQSSMARVAALVGGMALLVLLIAAANVTNLLLARALRRRREIAIRLALGAGRGRLLSLLLVESVLLALLGGIAGLLLAQWGGATLRAAFLPTAASAPVVSDPRTVVFVGIAALFAGLLTGLAAAWQARRVDLAHDLRAGVREGSRQRTPARAMLLVLQGALSVTLLVGAGLFVRSLTNARHLRLGFDVDPVLTVALRTRDVRLDSAQAVLLRDRLLATARSLPGVDRAALAIDLPLDGALWIGDLDVPAAAPDTRRRFHEIYRTAVSPDYFATIGTRILRGRAMDVGDVAGAPEVVVVSRSLAAMLWPGRDALGQCMKIGDRKRSRRATAAPCAAVVGIADDVKVTSLSDDSEFYYYLPVAQVGRPQQTELVVRTHGDASQQAEAIRRALQKEMPGASFVLIRPFTELVGEQMQSWRLGTTMFVAFGLLALTLAAVGSYAVVSYDAEQRAHEVGIRIALGAEPGDVVSLVVRRGALLGGAGVALGAVLTFAAAGRLAPLLFGVSPRDPLVYAAVAATMLGVATLASLIPALRAARADPVVALRAE
ncbi:MAG: ADOP family duplicated permease [Gemmatimonadota bacterium]|nr:ADOP family duplicated permease [Gemmatimonadota bacterium]